jgi:hypothetical protein
MLESDNIDNSQQNIINTNSDKGLNLVSTEDNPSNQASIENVHKEGLRKTSNANEDGTIGQRDKVELSPDCFIGPDVAPAELLKDLIAINPQQILDPLLTTQSSCFKKLDPNNILKWQKREISDPLLRMENIDDVEGSKQMFRNLLSYMGDRKSSKTPLLHAKNL